MDYAFIHQGKAYTPNQTKIAADGAEQHNAALEAQELAQWQAKPERFAGYVGDGRDLTTWRGVKIGTITERSTYRNNLGARIECITVRGTNGAIYYGRYGCDWSQLVRLRKAK